MQRRSDAEQITTETERIEEDSGEEYRRSKGKESKRKRIIRLKRKKVLRMRKMPLEMKKCFFHTTKPYFVSSHFLLAISEWNCNAWMAHSALYVVR